MNTGTSNDRPDDASDHTLMAMLSHGDKAALAALVNKYQNKIYTIARRTTGNHELAEDIAQEAFIRIWRSAPKYKPSAKVSTWIYRIVINLCVDAIRRGKLIAIEDFHLTRPGEDTTLSDIERNDNKRIIRGAIAKLPERQRTVIILHRLEGLPQREVAEITGWTESAVESLLVRAYRTLRKSLKNLSRE